MYVLPAIDASIATTFAAGLSTAAIYYLVNRRAGRSIARPGTLVLLVFAAAGVLTTFATAALTHSLWAMIPAAAFVVAYSIYQFAYGILFGTDRARAAGLLNAAAYILTLTLVALGVFIERSSPRLAIAGWVAGMAIAGSAGLVFALRGTAKTPGATVDTVALARFATRAGLVNLANLLNYRIDIYIVAIVAPVSVIGLYTLAVLGAESALSLTQALSQATLPRIGGLNRAEAGAFTARCLRNSVFLALMLAACGTAFAPIVIRLLFGPAYLAIVLPFRVLLIGLVAASTSSMIANYFMLNRGRARVPLATSLISTAVCAAISLALVPKFGMLGAAVGSTVAYCVSQTIAIAYFCNDSGISWMKVAIIDRRDLELYGRLLSRIVGRYRPA